MTTQGFLATRRHSPTSFALAFTVTGAGLAALLLANPYIRDTVIPDTTTIFTVPPPEPLDPPKPVVEPKHAVRPSTRIPPISRPTASTPPLVPSPPAEVVTGGGPATDFVKPLPPVVAEPVRIAEPVLVNASYDPRYAQYQQPPYPAAKQREEVEGAVTVRVRIATDGRVLAVEPVRASDEAFFVSTRDWALRKWRFRPATRDGVPVESWRTMSVRFTLTRD